MGFIPSDYINAKQQLHKGYIVVVLKDHPYSWKRDGRIYLHRVIVENNIGRYLTDDEIVHHLDENPLNNDISNLEILTSSDHVGKHKRYLKERPCIVCGTSYIPCKNKRKYCSPECAAKSKERTIWPTKEELEKLVWEKPSEEVGKYLGVSGRAIGKRCKKYGIQKPPRGYWAKKRAGKI